MIKLTLLRADQTGATAALSANDAYLVGARYVDILSKRTALCSRTACDENNGAAALSIPGGPAVIAACASANYCGGPTSAECDVGLRHDFPEARGPGLQAAPCGRACS